MDEPRPYMWYWRIVEREMLADLAELIEAQEEQEEAT